MKKETWQELLVKLIGNTKSGSIDWKPTDSAGSVIAPFRNASVTVRNVHTTPLAVVVTIGDVGHPIDLRDENGALVASLDDRGPAWSISDALQGSMGSSSDSYKLTTTADAQLKGLVTQLVAAIRARGDAGAKAAESIIDELD